MGTILNVTPDEVIRMQGDPTFRLVDVRDPSVYKRGHIPGSISLPDYAIKDQCAVKLPDKNAPIALYCQSGVHAMAAANLLIELGYTHVYFLGGIYEWPYGLER